DSLDWGKSKWFYTPQTAYTDFSALKKLSATTLKVNYSSVKSETNTTHTITVTNTGKSVAFFVHIRVLKTKNGDDILPVIFNDNYFLLAPGESRNITCSYLNKDAVNAVPYIITTAWNLDIQNSKAVKNTGFQTEIPEPSIKNAQ